MMAKLNHKSMRNVPEIYDEKKEVYSVSLTPTAKSNLDKIAKDFGLSRSELVEQIARNNFLLTRNFIS